ncbi:MAG: choice-of-anchor tandem repeat GloVer-containing protein [Verrucomicrobiota bacterium]
MKVNQFVWVLLLAGVAAVRLPAQTVETLCSFNGTNGSFPDAALTLGNDGNFYGTTWNGGSSGYGTVFKVTTNGTLTKLVSFAGTYGADPAAALTLGNDGNFYGTTEYGGNINLNGGVGYGTVFKLTTNGTLTTLVYFNGTNGSSPNAALTLGSDGNFYGTTWGGGITNTTYIHGMGTVFKLTTNGTLTTLVYFNGNNGSSPSAALTLGTDGNFYGTTEYGGSNGYGTVFKMTTNGTLTMLVSFNGINWQAPNGLTLGTDGNFYGTTAVGGNTNLNEVYGSGTVFQVTTNGTLTTLVSFNNTNGANPNALTLGGDGNFYGTTSSGGSSGDGTVFRLLLPPVVRPTLTLQFSAGCPQLNLVGTLSKNFVVQYRTNLADTNWVNLLSLTNLQASPYQFLDPAGVGQPTRFYRAVQSQ